MMTPEKRIEAIWSLLHAMAERENQMEIRFNQDIEWIRSSRETATGASTPDDYSSRV
jgi:hypothetical protein